MPTPPALPPDLADDVLAVSRLDVVPSILDVVCRITGLGFSAVARVTGERWIACAVRDDINFGMKVGGELQLETTICNEIRQSGEAVIISAVSDHEHFRHHPTPKMYGFESYVSMPIFRRGEFFGTLCAIDPKPSRVDRPEIVEMFRLFATLIGAHLESQERSAQSERALLLERERSVLQNQFVAVLGHDLRNPLAAIQAGAAMLKEEPTGERAAVAMTVIDRSANRMAGILDHVLDFAHGRLGSGLAVQRSVAVNLQPTLAQVVAELRATNPTRAIDSEIVVDRLLFVDPVRIGQLLSNLLRNALDHGDASGPVQVHARTSAAGLELSVTNTGAAIPASTRARLFEPFVRGAEGRSQGLGLGLYIASEIARSHGGRLAVESAEGTTRFALTIPASI